MAGENKIVHFLRTLVPLTGAFLPRVLLTLLVLALGIAPLVLAFIFLRGEAFTFWLSAFAAVVPCVFIIISQDIVRTAFWLLCSLTGFAGFYILLGADFLAMTQILVYLGGIMILILFGVLLTARDPLVTRRMPRLNLIVPGMAAAAVLAAGIGFGLSNLAFVQKDGGQSVAQAVLEAPKGTTVYIIGKRLLTDFILPFELASILLLAALVGAAYIARRGEAGAEQQA